MPPPGGVLVRFEHEDTGVVIWMAVMNSVPSEDDSAWYAELGDELVEYKVESVHWEFWKPKTFDDEATPSTVNCQHIPVVKVSEA